MNRGRRCMTECEQAAELVPPSESVDKELAKLAWAVAHPARWRILRILIARKACICGELVDQMPLAQSTVSQHLKILKEAGLSRAKSTARRSVTASTRRGWPASRDSLPGCEAVAFFCSFYRQSTIDDKAVGGFMMADSIVEQVRAKYAAVAGSGALERPRRRAGGRRGVRLHARTSWPPSPPRPTWASPAATPRPRRTCGPARPSSTSAAAAGSTCSSPPEGRPDRQGHRHRHDPRDDRAGPQATPPGPGVATSSSTWPGSTRCRCRTPRSTA